MNGQNEILLEDQPCFNTETTPNQLNTNFKSGNQKVGIIRIYFSSTISELTSANNQLVADAFRKENAFSVYLPQEYIPEVHHRDLERSAPQYCRRYIKLADIIILMMDSYGRDCSWEIGQADALRKTIVGFATDLDMFTDRIEDWMIKNSLGSIVTTNPQIIELCKKDKILQSVPSYLANSIQEVPMIILERFYTEMSCLGDKILLLNP